MEIDVFLAFRVKKRINEFTKKGVEWSLDIRFGQEDDPNNDWWSVCTYPVEPTEGLIKEAKAVIVRSYDIYHSNLYYPKLNIKVLE